MENKTRNIFKNIILLFSSVIICFILIEIFYRIFDPFPYIGYWETNNIEHGNLSQYDEVLGWRGVPNAKVEFVTRNSRTLLQHNRFGFRDIEHEENFAGKEVIVFLGDSFTWGYEVNFNEMFVNMLRTKLRRYEIFNLSHRGYGTDQELLTFNQWQYNGPVKLVILIFSKDDFGDNNATCRYDKYKPKYEFYDDRLTVINIPVPKGKWVAEEAQKLTPPSPRDRLKWLILQSHFINDIYFRTKNFRTKNYFKSRKLPETNQNNALRKCADQHVLTKRIIAQLKGDVIKRKGHLVVIAIPSEKQFMRNCNYIPYQLGIEKICKSLNIAYLDLAPAFKKAFFRSYYRNSTHWNKYGNKVAAKAIYDYLKNKFRL